jgi:branched-chain amino acid transport system substrate-binding protein
MRNFTKITRRTASPLLAAAVAALMLPTAAWSQSNAPIKFGLLMTLTGPGAAPALANRLGIDLAIKEINDKGGIMGRQITLVPGDDQANPTAGTNEVKRLVFQEKIDVLIGPIASAVTLAVLPTLTEGKVINISESGSAALTPEVGPYHFSMLASAPDSGRALVDYAASVGAKSVALLSDDSAAAKNGAEAIRDSLKEKNIKLAGEQIYKFHPTDVIPQLLSLKNTNPDYLLLYAAAQDDVGVVQKNIIESGWNVKQAGSLAAATAPELVISKAGPDAYKNMLGQVIRRFTYCPKDGEAQGNPTVTAFITKIRDFEKSRNAGGASITDYFNIANGYDAVNILKLAIEGTGGKTDGPTLSKWIIDNAAKIQLLTVDKVSASDKTHFLYSHEAFAMVENPHIRNDFRLPKRAGC